MARIAPLSTAVNLVLSLDKSETGKYPRVILYNSSDTVVDTVSLTEETSKGAGVYQGVLTTPATAGDYYAVYRVYTDAGFTTEDSGQPYNPTEEIYVTSSVEVGTPAYSQTDTITNTNTGAPIDGASIFFYSDSNRTTLLTSTTTNSAGQYTAYFDSTGTKYRRIIATGYDPIEDSITVS